MLLFHKVCIVFTRRESFKTNNNIDRCCEESILYTLAHTPDAFALTSPLSTQLVEVSEMYWHYREECWGRHIECACHSKLYRLHLQFA